MSGELLDCKNDVVCGFNLLGFRVFFKIFEKFSGPAVAFLSLEKLGPDLFLTQKNPQPFEGSQF